MKRAITATITGRVQGVGFRYNTREMGQRLGLTGWVRNHPEGSVEVLAQGDSDVVSRFIEFLSEGPPGSRVISMEVTDTAADPQLSGFRVRF
jgi:acylphosphatase